MPLLPTVCWVNDYDLSRHGLVVESYTGVQSSAEVRPATAPVLGRSAPIVLDRVPDVLARRLRIRGVLLAGSVVEARAQLEALRGRLARGVLEVRFADQPARVWYARRRAFEGTAIGPAVLSQATQVEIDLDLLDAYQYATEPTLLRLTSAGWTALDLGTAPSAPAIELMGPGTDPTVTYRRADGTVAGQMTCTVDLASSDVLRLDADAQVITRLTNGALTTANEVLTAGRWFALDPTDGESGAGMGPTLAVTAVTQGLVRYRKAWC